jgi:type IV pilus assembly protein PilO
MTMFDFQDPGFRKKLVFGLILVGGLGYLGFEYVFRPKAEQVAVLESRLETLQDRNRTARSITAEDGIADLELSVAMQTEQLKQVERLIPLGEELPDLLDAIAAEAQRTGVEITLIQPAAAVAEEFYTRRTYDLSVLGSYHQVGDFLGRVAGLPRIVTPMNLNMLVRPEKTRAGNTQIEAKLAIEMYVLSPNEVITDAVDVQ